MARLTILAFDVIRRGVILMAYAFWQAGTYAVSDLMSTCRQSCIGPPAPRNGAIRMTERNGIQQFLNRSNAASDGMSGF